MEAESPLPAGQEETDGAQEEEEIDLCEDPGDTGGEARGVSDGLRIQGEHK